jgi:uncharacterized protein (DUF1800 family)
MLRFLNNVQNKKNSPNENFAREVMELFTLGRGNYTEHDIQEAARAFTGWGINDEDKFELKTQMHDYGEKTIFGKTGKWEGEDVIRMILEKRETAYFITQKIYVHFVNRKVDEQKVQDLSEFFFTSGYDIPKLMRRIFESAWFYEEENVASQIKSPVELIVGLNRSFGISYDNPQPLLALQRVLGQTLFFPPNVSGWAGGRNWIDNSTLVSRMSLAGILADAGGMDISVKNDMDDESPNEVFKPSKKENFNCSFKWDLFSKQFKEEDHLKLWQELSTHLLATSKIPTMPETFSNTVISQREDLIKRMSIYLTQLPEYQLV